MQAPDVHDAPEGHEVAQFPQCVGSVATIAQTAGMPGPVAQLSSPAGQTQAPAVQVEPVAQMRPQAPQLFVSV